MTKAAKPFRFPNLENSVSLPALAEYREGLRHGSSKRRSSHVPNLIRELNAFEVQSLNQ